MVQKGIPKDPDFIHQYGGGVHQYGTKGASPLSDQSAEEFQRHMQANELQANQNQVPKISPQDMINVKNSVSLGPPNVQPLEAPAPENFGPPKVSTVQTDNQTDFGPPNSQSFKNVSQTFGAPKTDVAEQTQQQMSAQLSSQENQTTQTNLLGSSDGGPGGGSGGSGGDTKKATYKSVQRMVFNNMLENAMAHMKVKDPDPDAWS